MRPWERKNLWSVLRDGVLNESPDHGAYTHNVEEKGLSSRPGDASESLKRISISPNSLEVGRCRFSADSDSIDM